MRIPLVLIIVIAVLLLLSTSINVLHDEFFSLSAASLIVISYLEFFVIMIQNYITKKKACNKFEIQYVGSEVENIRYRATSNPNITNQRIDLTKLRSTLNITVH